MMVARLAYADLLAEREPDRCLPIVLDDPLVNLDENRRERALEVMVDAARRLQLIVLACRRHEYLGLPGATLVNLEGMMGTNRSAAAPVTVR
jgi:uncharacterized protein YhaN